jgi:glycyl-tRNA synthetase
MLVDWQLDFDLASAIRSAASRQPIEVSGTVQAEVLDFIIGRLRGNLLDAGYRHDIVDAVLAAQGGNPARAAQGVEQLTQWAARPDWEHILPAFARCVRITRSEIETFTVQPATLTDPAERALHAALLEAEAASRSSVSGLLSAFEPMIPAINAFFDAVLVMSENAAEKSNRLGLLQRIAALADGAADLSKLEGF